MSVPKAEITICDHSFGSALGRDFTCSRFASNRYGSWHYCDNHDPAWRLVSALEESAQTEQSRRAAMFDELVAFAKLSGGFAVSTLKGQATNDQRQLVISTCAALLARANQTGESK